MRHDRTNAAHALAPEPAAWPSLSTAAGPDELSEVLTGLGSQPRRLPCKLLYDARGSEGFRQRALWRPEKGRVEMHSVSRYRQTVRIAQRTPQLEEGEAIVTEHCYKYEPEAFAQLVGEAGFEVERVWLDPQRRFSVHLLRSV
ncbi:MAG: L-histidine N(alpha)-methyltransferase [Pseudomonadota bacterium]|jgi:uncharacterized SAM-dependent methyltransferase